MTTRTLFQAGSISKPVAAYGALKLVEEGKLSLEDNVNNYLNTWKLPDNEFTKEKPVALKNLLNHSGGVTIHGFNVYDSLGEAYMNRGHKEEAIKNYKKSLALNPDNVNAVEMLKRLEGDLNK